MPFASDVTRRGVSGDDWEINNSLRFNDDDSAYLSWTPSSAGNRKTWTLSMWIKRGNLSANTGYENILTVINTGYIAFSGDDPDCMRISAYHGANTMQLVTEQVFRDPSAWYHLVFKCDTTQATDTNRFKLYVNGSEVTAFKSTANNYSKAYPAQNFEMDFNNTELHTLGAYGGGVSNQADLHMAEVNFIDGSALAPTDFGEVDEDYGHWKAKEYSGTHGTNGFYLNFKTSGTLGNDASSNSNNWTSSNLATSDQTVDTPTNNFNTYLPIQLKQDQILYQGNTLRRSGDSYAGYDLGKTSMIIPKSGKWYAEFMVLGQRSNDPPSHCFGIAETKSVGYGAAPHQYGYVVGVATYTSTTYHYYYGSNAVLGTQAWALGDIVNVAYDADNGTLSYGCNGTWTFSNAVTGISSTADWIFVGGRFTNDGGRWTSNVLNAGQDATFAGYKSPSTVYNDGKYGSFYYQPPTDHKALCSQNLPDPAVKPGENFNVLTWSGNSTDARVLTGTGFAPNLTWIRRRSGTDSHIIQDTVRGANRTMMSNADSAENTLTNKIQAFGSDGVTLGTSGEVNVTGNTYVGWNWKAGTSVSGTTAGAGTGKAYSGSVNTSNGFSIIKYLGNGTAGHGIPHRLSKAPDIWIVKHRDASGGWMVGSSQYTDYTYWNALNDTFAPYNTASNNRWYSEPDASNVYIQTNAAVSELNTNDDDYLMYSWHSVDGFSKIGSYTGNGNADGVFVYTGFQPKYVLWKQTNGTGMWMIFDDARTPNNVMPDYLAANSSAIEASYPFVDFLSNGFKHRHTSGHSNGSADTYFYMAFAEFPFKYANAR